GANLGGMIGTDAAGVRSSVYGKTSDHARRLGVILSDGSRAEFGPVTAAEWGRKAEAATREGAAYRAVREVVSANAEEIARRFPRILRRVSGYDLESLRAGMTGDKAPPLQRGGLGLHRLIVGSEGTLAVIAEAELDLVPK